MVVPAVQKVGKAFYCKRITKQILTKLNDGYYDQTSADFDQISEIFPYILIVTAAGN